VKNIVGIKSEWNREFSCRIKTENIVVVNGCVCEMNVAITSDKDQNV
jgi:hypothetical protein